MLVTGQTGFKGSWLSLWLQQLGAEVTGFALPPSTTPSLFDAARIGGLIDHVEGDVRDYAAVRAVVERARPELIFHLAAQPLVRLSYAEPVETYATNVMGTVHVLEAARQNGQVAGIVCVTSDKCYANREWIWPYRENDPMGGHDPYSSSKGCAELAAAAWRSSYFEADGPALATVRAGNVIGGGDWSQDRLIPDLVRAFEAGTPPLIRSPEAVRPWQHVLEALGGYLAIAERLLAGDRSFADAWNFGPSDEDARPVGWMVERMRAAWSGGGSDLPETRLDTGPRPHEAGLLRLDSSKARAALGWQPALTLDRALEWIVAWHKAVAAGEDARAVTLGQIEAYVAAAGAPVRKAA
ncbi:CDP-glucose 4,6-dehydratase [Altererythrobacter xixiisoli]|uniref:CDP-glucose 4,6-dehydratase n=1 Tax=Croceibacterium xixiisoli TaxID=1476466 RepID=A0A6I4TRI7_9SPHN|nr:CDP-glucose 4,6-dehydratase [Croceibacterium xixiisoli]